MEVEFHERDWGVDAEVVGVVVPVWANPGKISLVEVLFEGIHAMFEHGRWVVLVEGFEEGDDLVLLGG